jgi:hypothetical protein
MFTRSHLANNAEILVSDHLDSTLNHTFTSRKLSMDYVTVDGVILRTGYSNKRDWYLVCIRELLDNAADFLWEFYKGSSNAAIIVEIFKDDTLFRLKVRNSNDDDIPIFSDSNIATIFDYEGRYGSKQDVHVISLGMLGDALKQILAFGYVLLHANDNGTEFIDKQWEQPLILRHNKIEHKYILEIDKANQNIRAKQIEKREFADIGTDTEIELVLPVIDDEVRDSLDRACLEEYCRKYPIFTTDISFIFNIIADSSNTSNVIVHQQKRINEQKTISKELLTAPSNRVTINLPALHPISTDKWNKTDSIHSYKSEEFIRRILNVHDKKVAVYDLLRIFREGTNIKRTEDNEIYVEKLVSLPKDDLAKKMRLYYDQLKSALHPPAQLSLPYNTKNKKQRMNVLKARVASIYDIDSNKEPIYKSLHGYYNDRIIQYPFLLKYLRFHLNIQIGQRLYFLVLSTILFPQKRTVMCLKGNIHGMTKEVDIMRPKKS